MRPKGSYGDVTRALLQAAQQRPGTVRELAQRSQVGFDVARKAASRLKAAGELEPISEGRPEVLAPVGDRSGESVLILDRLWLQPAGRG